MELKNSWNGKRLLLPAPQATPTPDVFAMNSEVFSRSRPVLSLYSIYCFFSPVGPVSLLKILPLLL
jgi:hypothetical protein